MTDHERELHDPRLTALYHRKDGEQPPARVDAEIRKAAHAAVKPPASRRWWPSLATAAVLVLGVGVALKVFEQPVLERSAFDRPSMERRDGAPGPLEQERGPAASADRRAAEREAFGKARPASAAPPVRSHAADAAADSVDSGDADSERVDVADPAPAVTEASAGLRRRDAALPDGCSAYVAAERMDEADLRTALESARARNDPVAVRCLEHALHELERSP